MLDYTVYVANISDPEYQVNGPKFESYYSVKEAYGSKLDPPVTDPKAELTPAVWHQITQLFQEDDATFQDYYARKSRGYNPSNCNGTCKSNELCQLTSAQSQYACLTSNAILKRDQTMSNQRSHHGEDCGRSVMKNTFARLLPAGRHRWR